MSELNTIHNFSITTCVNSPNITITQHTNDTLNNEIINENNTIETLSKDKKIAELQSNNLLLKNKNELLKNENESLKKTVLSYKNSETAKNGYREEVLVSKDLANKDIQDAFSPILDNDYNGFSKISGNSKCDIQSNDNLKKAQVKKYKPGQFQQLDRHTVDHLVEHIPQVKPIKKILIGLCEIPLLSNGTHVDKTEPVKKICQSNYSDTEISNFVSLLNKIDLKLNIYLYLKNIRCLLNKPSFMGLIQLMIIVMKIN